MIGVAVSATTFELSSLCSTFLGTKLVDLEFKLKRRFNKNSITKMNCKFTSGKLNYHDGRQVDGLHCV